MAEGLVGRTLGGEFELRSVLARGGQAVVYRAYSASRATEVAVKVLSPSLSQDPSFRQRFLDEFRSLAQLHHENLIEVYRYGIEDGLVYIAMRLVPGGTLGQRLEALAAPVDLVTTARLIGQVASALQHAHDHGLVHLDIKPSNILLGRADWPLLADFGITRAVQLEQTGHGRERLAGTPLYMSPEQCQGGPLDGRSDEYSLAITAYEMLTGQQPFHAPTTEQILQQHLRAPPPRPRERNPGIPGPVEEVLLRGLAKNPADRYPTIQEFGAALAEAVERTRGVSLETKAALAVIVPNFFGVLGVILLSPVLLATLPRLSLFGGRLAMAWPFQLLFCFLLAGLLLRVRWPVTGLIARALGAAVDAAHAGASGPRPSRDPTGARWRKRLVGTAEGLTNLAYLFIGYRLIVTPLSEIAGAFLPPTVTPWVILGLGLVLAVFAALTLIGMGRLAGPLITAGCAGLILSLAAAVSPISVGSISTGTADWPVEIIIALLTLAILVALWRALRTGAQRLAAGLAHPMLVEAQAGRGSEGLARAQAQIAALAGASTDLVLGVIALLILQSALGALLGPAIDPATPTIIRGAAVVIWLILALRLAALGGWPGMMLALLGGAPLLVEAAHLLPGSLGALPTPELVGWGGIIGFCFVLTLVRGALQSVGSRAFGAWLERRLVGVADAPSEAAAARRASAFGALVGSLIDAGLLIVGYWIAGPPIALALARGGPTWVNSAILLGLTLLLAANLALAFRRVHAVMTETGGDTWAGGIGATPGFAIGFAALLISIGGATPVALAAPETGGLALQAAAPPHVIVGWQYWLPATPSPALATYNLALSCSDGETFGEFREAYQPKAGAAMPAGSIDAASLPVIACADWRDAYFALRGAAGLDAPASVSRDWLDIRITLNADGSADVTEDHRVLFTAGTHTRLTWTEAIQSGRELSQLEASDDDLAYPLNPAGHPSHYAQTSSEANALTITWNFPPISSPAVRTFTLRYHLDHAIQTTSQGSEFRRSVIRPGGTDPIWRTTVAVQLRPSDPTAGIQVESMGAPARAELVNGREPWFAATDLPADGDLTVIVRFGSGGAAPPTPVPPPTPTVGSLAAVATPTVGPSLTPLPTHSPSPTASPAPTDTLTPTATATLTVTEVPPSPTASPTQTPSAPTVTPSPQAATATVTVAPTKAPPPTNTTAPLACGTAPILAMYYAWYDMNSWNDTLSDQPVAPYNSADRATIERQVAQAQSVGIDGFELNWWGPNNPTDTNLQTLLAVAQGKGFKVTADFDLNSPFVHNAGELAEALKYLARYSSNPAWFQYRGKPFIVFYGIRKYDVATWATIRQQVDPNHQTFWMGEGDQFDYLKVFDGIHPYSIAWSANPAGQLASYAQRARAYSGKAWMATAMPGYNDLRINGAQGIAVDRANGDYYKKTWQGAVATKPDILNITSFNEWREGSYLEPSKTYGDHFLTLTRQLVDSYRNRAGCR